jgi:hypothetical protein
VGKLRAPVELDDQLKAVLACPFCKGPLEFHEEWREAWCLMCRLVWPIENGVPDLVLGSSRPLKP